MRCLSYLAPTQLLALAGPVLLWPLAAPLSAGEINACKYLIVNDFTNDPYGIAAELRTQASARGFIVASTANEIPADERPKGCWMAGSWVANGVGGQISIRVADASGSLVGEATGRATAWVNASRTVRAAVSKIYSQLGYSGFEETTFRERRQREFPKRPSLAISEDDIKKVDPRSRIEGIWTDSEDRYPLGL